MFLYTKHSAECEMSCLMNVYLVSQHMIADTVRLIRQCQKDHMGKYSDGTVLILWCDITNTFNLR